jgi:2-oxoisovalerate dehydrogenase E1 component alpha subunit
MPKPASVPPPPAEPSAEPAPTTCVAQFEVHYTQILGADGKLRGPLPSFATDAEELRSLYREMLLLRAFDRKAVALQRTGRLGTYAPCVGQEAVGVGLGRAMAREDVLLGTYRETGAMLARGVTMAEILLYWSGDERGMAYSGPQAPREDFPISVPIATHAPQAVGVAYAFKLRREPRVAVCVVGDGATSKGDFYEALNGAGVWQLPLVFVIVNNEWAISVPRSRQSQAQTLAQKAIAAGIPGEQIDGNDLLAVKAVLDRALDKARRGGGPHVIEMLTYRLGDHTTADDARRYRPGGELDRRQLEDPLLRLKKFLLRERIWNEDDESAALENGAAKVEQAVNEFLAVTTRAPRSMFEHLFAELPAALREQSDSLAGEAPHE